MSDRFTPEDLEIRLKKMCPRITVVKHGELKGNIIQFFSFQTDSINGLSMRQLNTSDAPDLYHFYFDALSDRSRKLFASYPLFSSLPASQENLACRITEWKNEHDWSFLNVLKDNRIIAAAFLKKCSTVRPTSGIAVSDEYQHKGLGYILQSVINLQAYFLGVKKLFIKIEQGNMASLKLHEKCGFKQIGVVPYAVYDDNWVKVEQQVIEMARELSKDNF